MNQLLVVKFVSIALILASTLFSGIYPFFKKIRLGEGADFPVAQAFSAGVFLGAGLIHMLGDSAQSFSDLHIHYPISFLLAGMTFLGLLFLEHLGREIYEHQGDKSPAFAVLAFVLLSIHSILAGTALGLTGAVSLAIILLTAILAHKWAESFALAVQINKSTLNTKKALGLFLVFSIMTPLGILLGAFISTSFSTKFSVLPAVFNALAAGTFLYLGTLHGLARSILITKCCNLKYFTFVILGFILMAVAAIWA